MSGSGREKGAGGVFGGAAVNFQNDQTSFTIVSRTIVYTHFEPSRSVSGWLSASCRACIPLLHADIITIGCTSNGRACPATTKSIGDEPYVKSCAGFAYYVCASGSPPGFRRGWSSSH